MNHDIRKIASFWINTITPQMDLSALDDKVVTLRVDTPEIEQTLYFYGQRVELERIPHREADIIITGDIYTVIQFLGGNDRAKVTIEGDLSLAVALQQIIQSANIDCQNGYHKQPVDSFQIQFAGLIRFGKNDYNQTLLDRINELEARIRILEQKQSS